jgi:hypothetical protein
MKAPATVPTRLPRPPSRLVPPITTAAMAGSTYCVPTVGDPDPVCTAKASPAAAAKKPESP